MGRLVKEKQKPWKMDKNKTFQHDNQLRNRRGERENGT